MIKIDGTEIPAPSGYTVSIEDITKADRNANGLLIAERIATKRKITLEYRMLTAEEMSQILSLINANFFFDVTYPDPETNGDLSGTFYSGGRNANGILYQNGKISYWRDVSFSLIER